MSEARVADCPPCGPCPVIKEQIRVLAEHSLSNIRSQTSLMLSFAVMILELSRVHFRRGTGPKVHEYLNLIAIDQWRWPVASLFTCVLELCKNILKASK